MPLDPDALLNLTIPEVRHTYGWRDTALYALGLGCGDDPMDEKQLAFLDDTKIQALPSMANVLAHPGFWIRDLETGIDHLKVVHGEQSMILHNRLPAEGTVIGRTKITQVIDKGKAHGALVYTRRELTDADSGKPLATVDQTTFCRGDGGFGGRIESQPPPRHDPDRPPDLVVEIPTSPQLALIYRLSGDINPLHSDPSTARRAGFHRPILHGLATFGIACRGLMSALCENRPEAVKTLSGRFFAPVFPGESVALNIWQESSSHATYTARVPARDSVVLKNGTFGYCDP